MLSTILMDARRSRSSTFSGVGPTTTSITGSSNALTADVSRLLLDLVGVPRAGLFAVAPAFLVAITVSTRACRPKLDEFDIYSGWAATPSATTRGWVAGNYSEYDGSRRFGK